MNCTMCIDFTKLVHLQLLYLFLPLGGPRRAASLSRLSFSSLASCSDCISMPFALSGLKTLQQQAIKKLYDIIYVHTVNSL